MGKALIDNVLIEEPDAVTEEHFTFPHGKKWVFFIFFTLIFSASSAYVFFLKKRRMPSKTVFFSFLTALMTLGIILLLVFFFRYLFFTNRYPVADKFFEKEEAWKEVNGNAIRRTIREQVDPANTRNSYRILFVGASQTWGAGASAPSDTFVRRIEDELNRTRQDVHFECINAGASGLDSNWLIHNFYLKEWIDLKPNLVVVDLSNNEENTEDFRDNLEKMVVANKDRGIETLLVLEPNSIECESKAFLNARHEVMRQVAACYNVPLIDMHRILLQNYDSGFIWWDFDHLTSYGHRLFASEIVNVLQSLFLKDDSLSIRFLIGSANVSA